MRQIALVLMAMGCSLALAMRAQDTTNLPPTEIENFELQTDVVIVKGFEQAGSMTTSAGVISVRCKESANAITGRREYGIVVVLESNLPRREFLIVDYDELAPLIGGLDYLGKISHDASSMPAFDATFTTKSGLRVAAHTERLQGGIQDFLQFGRDSRIPLTPDQFAQFKNLISQAKTLLDTVRDKNSSP
jgi:hypothetical protein